MSRVPSCAVCSGTGMWDWGVGLTASHARGWGDGRNTTGLAPSLRHTPHGPAVRGHCMCGASLCLCAGTGNANFFYFLTLAFNACQVWPVGRGQRAVGWVRLDVGSRQRRCPMASVTLPHRLNWGPLW